MKGRAMWEHAMSVSDGGLRVGRGLSESSKGSITSGHVGWSLSVGTESLVFVSYELYLGRGLQRRSKPGKTYAAATRNHGCVHDAVLLQVAITVEMVDQALGRGRGATEVVCHDVCFDENRAMLLKLFVEVFFVEEGAMKKSQVNIPAACREAGDELSVVKRKLNKTGSRAAKTTQEEDERLIVD